MKVEESVRHERDAVVDQHRPDVTVCQISEGRQVFLEADNADGWISSDVTVDLEQ